MSVCTRIGQFLRGAGGYVQGYFAPHRAGVRRFERILAHPGEAIDPNDWRVLGTAALRNIVLVAGVYAAVGVYYYFKTAANPSHCDIESGFLKSFCETVGHFGCTYLHQCAKHTIRSAV